MSGSGAVGGVSHSSTPDLSIEDGKYLKTPSLGTPSDANDTFQSLSSFSSTPSRGSTCSSGCSECSSLREPSTPLQVPIPIDTSTAQKGPASKSKSSVRRQLIPTSSAAKSKTSSLVQNCNPSPKSVSQAGSSTTAPATAKSSVKSQLTPASNTANVNDSPPMGVSLPVVLAEPRPRRGTKAKKTWSPSPFQPKPKRRR